MLKGTIIRLFSLPDGARRASFRRGAHPATVYSISFSQDSTLLAVSSDTGTVHVFKVLFRT